MALTRKHIISPGDYWTQPDPSKPAVVARVTAERIQHWHDEGNRMVQSLGIPIPLEHQLSAVPVSLADRQANAVKNNSGWVNQYIIANGELYADVDVTDEEIAKKLPTTIKYVSPRFDPQFTDGSGKVWKDVITHIALTPQPVFTKQKPFAPIALSQPFCLSLQNRVEDKGEEDDSEKEKDGKEPDEKESQKPKGKDHFSEAKGLLADHNIHLPEDTTEESGWEHLCVALHALKAAVEGLETELDPEEEEEETMTPEEIKKKAVQEPEYVAMSQKLAANETELSTLKASHAVEIAANKRLQEQFAEERFKAISIAIDGLVGSGRAAPADADVWKAALGGHKLSLVTGATDIDKVLTEIEFSKKLPEGVFWSPEQKTTQLSAKAPPEPVYGEFDYRTNGVGQKLATERVDKILEEAYGKQK